MPAISLPARWARMELRQVMMGLIGA